MQGKARRKTMARNYPAGNQSSFQTTIDYQATGFVEMPQTRIDAQSRGNKC
jgi:hypothetical protein